MDPFLKLLTHNLLTYDSLTYDSIIIPALKTLVNLTGAITPDEPDKQRRRYITSANKYRDKMKNL